MVRSALAVERVVEGFPVLKYVGPTPGGRAAGPEPATSASSGRIPVCGSLLLGAILMLAGAGSGLVVGAAIGLLGVPLLIAAGVTASIGLALMTGWMLECRDCRAIRYLQRYFLVMGALMVALAGPFLLAGMVGAAVGAGLVAALFGLIVATLTAGASRLDCPALTTGGER
jgi:hypothetical protein